MRGQAWLAAALAIVTAACSDGHDRDQPHAADAAQSGGGGGGATSGSAAGSSGARDAGSGVGNDAAVPMAGASALDATVGADATVEPDAAADANPTPEPASGVFTVLTYNVAGLPEPLSSSLPATYTPMIGPLLNGYELVLLQESWQTPEVNPFAPLLRGYHEILVATADHPYKTVPADQPFGNDARRPSALLGDGLNVFSRFPLGETTRVAWSTCVDTASDCLAFKGFSLTPAQLADGVPLHIYDLHMEAGGSPEDDEARALGIEQMIAFMEERSRDVALLVGGDFNLHTDGEPAASQFARLQEAVALVDACTALDCEDPGSIDKVLVRSSDQLELTPEAWESEADVFVSDMGLPLSDHLPVAVRIAWSTR